MRTARWLPYGGSPWQRPPQTETPPVNRITDKCKNIIFPQLRLLAVKIAFSNTPCFQELYEWSTCIQYWWFYHDWSVLANNFKRSNTHRNFFLCDNYSTFFPSNCNWSKAALINGLEGILWNNIIDNISSIKQQRREIILFSLLIFTAGFNQRTPFLTSTFFPHLITTQNITVGGQ